MQAILDPRETSNSRPPMHLYFLFLERWTSSARTLERAIGIEGILGLLLEDGLRILLQQVLAEARAATALPHCSSGTAGKLLLILFSWQLTFHACVDPLGQT
jgi:hypothetical protein